MFFSCGRKIHHEFAVAQCCCGAQTQALRIALQEARLLPDTEAFTGTAALFPYVQSQQNKELCDLHLYTARGHMCQILSLKAAKLFKRRILNGKATLAGNYLKCRTH